MQAAYSGAMASSVCTLSCHLAVQTVNNFQRPSSVVTIPHTAWAEVRDVLIDFCDQLPYQPEEVNGESTSA